MSATNRWTRERAKAGPADTLDGRWEITGGRSGPRSWTVLDRRTGTVIVAGIATMREAREIAEHVAERYTRHETMSR